MLASTNYDKADAIWFFQWMFSSGFIKSVVFALFFLPGLQLFFMKVCEERDIIPAPFPLGSWLKAFWPGGIFLAGWYVCAIGALKHASPDNFWGTSGLWQLVSVLGALALFVYGYFFWARRLWHPEVWKFSVSLWAYCIVQWLVYGYLVLRLGCAALLGSAPLEAVAWKLGMLVFGLAWVVCFVYDRTGCCIRAVARDTFFVSSDEGDMWVVKTVNKVGTDAYRNNAPRR